MDVKPLMKQFLTANLLEKADFIVSERMQEMLEVLVGSIIRPGIWLKIYEDDYVTKIYVKAQK